MPTVLACTAAKFGRSSPGLEPWQRPLTQHQGAAQGALCALLPAALRGVSATSEPREAWGPSCGAAAGGSATGSGNEDERWGQGARPGEVDPAECHRWGAAASLLRVTACCVAAEGAAAQPGGVEAALVEAASGAAVSLAAGWARHAPLHVTTAAQALDLLTCAVWLRCTAASSGRGAAEGGAGLARVERMCKDRLRALAVGPGVASRLRASGRGTLLGRLDPRLAGEVGLPRHSLPRRRLGARDACG
jgi:hypothetical protein